MKSNKLTGAVVMCVAVAWSQYAQAIISVDRTRVIMDGKDKSVSVTLSNDDKHTPYLAQAWVTDSSGVRTNDLLVLPPLQRIDGGQKSQVRITQVRSLTDRLPQDRETLFWFDVRGIPPKAEEANVLQLAMQSRLKLFYRPASISKGSSSDQPEKKLVAERDGGHLTLQNPTPYYITVVWLGVQKNLKLDGFTDAVMVPPLGNLSLKATLPVRAGQLWVGYVDDYGGLQMNRYTCDARRCKADGGASS